MTINKISNGSELTVALEGRLDTNTAPELEAFLNESLENVTALILDFEKLSYISSAGLRVLLSAQTVMNWKEGSMKVTRVSKEIMDIFEVTGFAGFLTIE